MLIAYSIVGAIVFVTMLSLGEMAAYTPIAGSFCTFAGRYVDDAFGFALTWGYWLNDVRITITPLTHPLNWLNGSFTGMVAAGKDLR